MESQYPDAMVEVEGMATEDFRKGQRRAGRAGKDLFLCGRERVNNKQTCGGVVLGQRSGGSGAISSLATISFIASLTNKIPLARLAQLYTRLAVYMGGTSSSHPFTSVWEEAIQVTQEVLSHSFVNLESPVLHQWAF